MDFISLENILSTGFLGDPLVQQLVDLLLKSSLIVGVTLLIIRAFNRKLSHNAQHLLWLNSLLCAGALLLIEGLSSALPGEVFAGDAFALTIITVRAGTAGAALSADWNINPWLSSVYLFVVFVFVSRLVYAAIGLNHLSRESEEIDEGKEFDQLSSLCARMGVSRRVSLMISAEINSPMSFGLFSPVVMIPSSAKQWSESNLEDVFVHELSHIRRLDWPVMLFCHLVCSVLWFNPLVWFAKSRVNHEAEQACDLAVLGFGKDGVGYAEDLLRLAKMGSDESRAPVLAQLMFEKRGLSMRIKNILDGSIEKRISKIFLSLMMCFTVLFVTGFSNVQVFGASDDVDDQEYLPVTAEPPLYPTRAAEAGIEGWILLRFTVTNEGTVDASSLETIDSEPQDGIFERSSFRAAEKFLFQPRVVDGVPVAVEGVQYLFRYSLGNDNILEGVRPPPEARSRR